MISLHKRILRHIIFQQALKLRATRVAEICAINPTTGQNSFGTGQPISSAFFIKQVADRMGVSQEQLCEMGFAPYDPDHPMRLDQLAGIPVFLTDDRHLGIDDKTRFSYQWHKMNGGEVAVRMAARHRDQMLQKIRAVPAGTDLSRLTGTELMNFAEDTRDWGFAFKRGQLQMGLILVDDSEPSTSNVLSRFFFGLPTKLGISTDIDAPAEEAHRLRQMHDTAHMLQMHGFNHRVHHNEQEADIIAVHNHLATGGSRALAERYTDLRLLCGLRFIDGRGESSAATGSTLRRLLDNQPLLPLSERRRLDKSSRSGKYVGIKGIRIDALLSRVPQAHPYRPLLDAATERTRIAEDPTGTMPA